MTTPTFGPVPPDRRDDDTLRRTAAVWPWARLPLIGNVRLDVPIKGVLFDMDGTLTKPNLDFGEMYRRVGVDRKDDILVAIAAMEHGFDPVALREKNMLRPPYRSPTGTHIKSGVFAGHIKEALARSEYHSFAARREADAAKGLMRGIGMGCFLETSRGVPEEGASVHFLADGTIEIAVGAPGVAQAGLPVSAAGFFALSDEAKRMQSVRVPRLSAAAKSPAESH